jgi:hypothetical protein
MEVESLITKDISYVTEQLRARAAEGEGLARLMSMSLGLIVRGAPPLPAADTMEA